MPMPAYRGVFKDSINRETENIISKSTYRISVCLKRYFNDMRALCYVLISRKKTVKWLEKKIKKLFNVNGEFVLTSRGHLLPPSERLGLLNADDIVEVVPNEVANELKNKMKCVHAVTNNGSNVENDSISFDENDSAVNKNQIYSTTITLGQKDTLQELELGQRIIRDNQYQNETDSIWTSSNSTAAADVVDVESEYKTTEKCDSGASAKKKKYSFEQKDPSKVELEKSAENDISNNSNIHYLSTDEVQDELEVMKINALALLDSSFSVCSNRSQNSSNIGGTRKRKRVRRKRQQVLLPEEMSENNIENDNFKDILPHENEINNVTECPKTLAVLHNEEICIRKPRIVKSILE
ncbi:uncharacterized protein LOC121731979 [Aricia agestis]|uniref:uncharacterized protein LOC121731979 n=1 Tax=Aricia agestis TaxID=91739 RepID=UPI001C20B58D|nr:uncharacterized protein LOC121731979 [Aricia agestis]